MKQLFGTNYQECTASQLSTAVSKPCDGITSTVSLDGTQSTTFLFTLDDVIGYDINSDGALVVSFKDSSTLLIPNFEALADADYSIKLEDGTVVEFAALAEGGQPMSAAEVQLDFSQNDIESVELAENRMAILLNNGEKRFIDLEAGSDTTIAFADGATISPEFLFAECKVEGLFDDADFAEVAPAAGTPVEAVTVAEAPVAPKPTARKVVALEDDGSDLADIEPAAGTPAGAVRNTGASFGSALDSRSIGGIEDVGPIGPTSLQFDLPSTDPVLFAVPTPAAVAPPPPTVSAVDECVLEDTNVQLQVTAESSSTTPADEVLTVDIIGIPTSWTFIDLAGGTYDATTLTWTITLPAGASFSGGPTIAPPADSDIDAGTLTAVAVVQDVNTLLISEPTETDFDVNVDAVADPTNVSASGGSATVSSSVGIDVTASLNDTDGSEEISNIVINGIPSGVTLSAGTLNQDGSYSLTLAQLPGLTASSTGYVGTFTGTVTVVNTDIATDEECDTTNNEEFTSANFTVTFNVDVTVPTVSVNNGLDNVCIAEDGSKDVPVSVTGNGSTDETIAVTISGLPTASGWGVDLTGLSTQGTYNASAGTVTINLPANTDLSGSIKLTPPANSDVDAPTLTLSAVATEPSTGETASATDSATVTVDAVADNVNITANDLGTLAAGSTVALDVATSLKDTDGSESITGITLSGFPVGVTLSAGTMTSAGTFTFANASELSGLTMTLPSGLSGSFNVSMQVDSAENPTDMECDVNNNLATINAAFTFNVDFDPVAPTVMVQAPQSCIDEDSTVDVPVSVVGNGTNSETMVVTISNLPANWTIDASNLTGGTVTQTATTITVDLPANTDLGGFLRMTPPANSDVDSPNITVSAVATEPANQSTASASTDFLVTVDAVADGTNVSASGGSSTQNGTLPISISASLNDTDGSESIQSITITGVPSGVTLSAGTLNANGSYTLTPAQLTGLTATSNGYAGSFSGTVTVNSAETTTSGAECDLTDNTAQDVARFNVSFSAVSVTPTVDIDDVCIPEDSTREIPITVTGNGSASETMEVTISGLPTASGWTVDLSGLSSTATYNAANGTAVINLPANTNLSGVLRLTPPVNSDVDAPDITVSAVATEPASGDTSSASATAMVNVDAIADNVNLSASGGSAQASDPVALSIATSLRDLDGSEEITSITITDIPSNVTLSAGTLNANGSYTLTPAQLTGLTANSNGYVGTFQGTVRVESQDNPTDMDCNIPNNFASNSVNFSVTFNQDATPPTVSVNNGIDFLCVPEDSSMIELPVSAVGNGTNNETMVVTISGLPQTGEGWTVNLSGLTGGTPTYNAATGTVTVNLPANTNLGGSIRLTPPANSDVDLGDVTISAVATEPSTGQTATANDTSYVRVDAIADGTNVNASGGNAIATSSVNLNVTAALRDTDGSESIDSITITGVPSGVTLSAGTLNANGSYTLTPAQLTGLTATSNGYTGTFQGTVTVASSDNPTDMDCDLTNNDASNSANFSVTFNPDVQPPTVSVNNGIDFVCIPEDSNAVDVPVSAVGNGTNNETMVVTISGLPTASGWGVDLSGLSTQGTYNAATGTVTINLPANTDLSGSIKLTPPTNSDIDVGNVSISAVATEPSTGQTANASDTTYVRVDAIADNVNLSASGGSASASGDVSLSIATSLRDTDGSETIESITITGIPSGVTLSAGTLNANGSYTLTPAQLTGLTASSNGYAGTFQGTVRVVSRDNPTDMECELGNNDAIRSANFSVTFNPDVQPPTVSVNNGIDDVCIPEDGMGIIPVSAVGNGTNNETMVVTISGLPTASGWGVDLSGLSTQGTYNAATGTVTINLPANTNLSGSIKLTPPADSDVDAPTLTIKAVATEPSTGENASATDSAVVKVDAVADGTNVNASGGSATVGSYVNLAVGATLRDTDGSETIQSITITGVPSGVTLSDGVRNANGSYTLTPAQLSGLTAFSNGYTGTFNAKVTVNSAETNLSGEECDLTNNNASNSANFSVTFNPASLAPTVLVNNGVDDVCIAEDGSKEIPVSAVGNGSGNETMVVTIMGLPTAAGWGVDLSGITGGTPNYNAANGTVTINLGANVNLGGSIKLTPPANSDVDAPTLTLRAVATEPSTGENASATDSAVVKVDAVADGVNLTASGGSATSTGNVGVAIATSLKDTDGSETITSITITGVPSNVELSAGTRNANGSYTLTPAQLNGLSASSNGYVGTFQGTVRVNSGETNLSGQECDLTNNSAVNNANFNVTFTQQVTPPTVSVNSNVDIVCIPEDGTVNVPISAIGNGSNQETMVVTISGLPTASGWTVNTSGLTGGTVNYNAANGTATINLPANTNLGGSIKLTPPTNSDIDVGNLTVSATVTEPSSGQTATSSDTAFLRVDAVADGINVQTSEVDAFFFDNAVSRSGNTNSVMFVAELPYALRDADGSESVTNVAATGTAAQYLSNLQLTSDGRVTGTLTWTGSRNSPPDFNGTIRVTTTDTPNDAECDLTNNQIVQDISLNFDFTNVGTPLILDLNGDGFEFTSVENGVAFDIDGDGDVDQSAWLSGADDVFLALDNNGNGSIDDATELFGTDNGQYQNGFDKLAAYDSNQDGMIDANDDIFGDLRLWSDLNGDGQSQDNELYSLADRGVASINLNSSSVFENLGGDTGYISDRSTFTNDNGETRDIVDVNLVYEDVNDVDQAINEFVVENGDDEVITAIGDGTVGQPDFAAEQPQHADMVDLMQSIEDVNQNG